MNHFNVVFILCGYLHCLGIVWDESLMDGFEWEKEVTNPLFDYDSPTLVVAFLFVTSKVAALVSATRTFYVVVYTNK